MTEVNEVNFSKGGKMAEGEGAKGGLGKIIRMAVIGLVVLVLIGAGGGAAWYFLIHKGSDKPEKSGTAAVRTEVQSIENPQYIDMGSFIVNLADGRRYAKVSMTVMLSDDKAKAYLTSRLVEAKDLALAELQSLSEEGARDPRERELVRQHILTRLETLMPVPAKDWTDPHPIKKLLFTEFYLQ